MLPLEGIKVLDLSHFLSGARCAQLLSNSGAEVIKVEPPQGETLRILSQIMSGMEKVLALVNTNKKGITLNLQTKKGQELFKELVKKVDVVIENFIPGTMKKFNLNYEVLKEINPRLIYAVISGFGQTGPLSFKSAFDVIAQATGGILSCYRTQDKPPRTFFGDLVSGAYAAVGILIALIAREKTNKGQLIDISMQDVMYYHNFPAMTNKIAGKERDEFLRKMGKTKEEAKEIRDRGIVFWNCYKAQDGYVAVVALTDGQWKRFMKVIGKEELLKDERFSNPFVRFFHSDELRPIVEEWSSNKPKREIVKILDEARIPAGEVKELEDLENDEQLAARDMYYKLQDAHLGELIIPGTPIKFSETPSKITTAYPQLGEHNEEIYTQWLNLSKEDLEQLRKEGVI